VLVQGKNRHIQNAALRLLLFAVELLFALRFPDVLELLFALRFPDVLELLVDLRFPDFLELLVDLELLFVFEIPGR